MLFAGPLHPLQLIWLFSLLCSTGFHSIAMLLLHHLCHLTRNVAPSQPLLHKQCFYVFPFSIVIMDLLSLAGQQVPFALLLCTSGSQADTLRRPSLLDKLSPPPPQPHRCWDKSSSTSHNAQTRPVIPFAFLIPFASQPSFPRCLSRASTFLHRPFRMEELLREETDPGGREKAG